MNKFDGATRIHFIVGDPIAQVKSPFGVSEALQAKGLNAVCLPLHINSENFKACLIELSKAKNIDGLIITVPHKFAATNLCATLSDRAHFLGAANTLRRNADGTWHGDMFDGIAWVQAMREKGESPKGKSALLVGAGGAGSAISHALLEAGVTRLAIHDASNHRKNRLIERLSSLKLATVVAGSANPHGFDIIVNATPQGMNENDVAPVSLGMLNPSMYVGDVITAPAVTHLIAFAQSIGCRTQTGIDMFSCVKDLMVNFLTHEQSSISFKLQSCNPISPKVS